MKKFMFVALACGALAIAGAKGAEPAASPAAPSPAASAADVEALRQQVQSLTELVQTLQKQVKEQQAANDKNNSNPPALPQNPEPETAAGPSPSPAASAPPLFPTTDNAVVASAPPPVNANGTLFPTTDESVTATVSSSDTGSSLTQPISLTGGGNKNYMNISFDGMFALAASSARHLDRVEVGDHDPQQRGFNGRNAEIALDGAVDPYFEGFANIVLKLDNFNQTEIELEEAFLQTTNLPYGLQIKAGQFFDAFGRINPTHPHTWEFADSPLVNGRLLGPDGLRGVGAQIAWAVPVPWYSQVIFAVQNGRGGTAYSFRNPGDNGVFYGRMTFDREASALRDLVFVPRVENSFNLSDTQTVLVSGMRDKIDGSYVVEKAIHTYIKTTGIRTTLECRAPGNGADFSDRADEEFLKPLPGEPMGSVIPDGTFNGSVPGPILKAREGDGVTIALINHTGDAHGIDVHAAQIAPVHFAGDPIKPVGYTFSAAVPGVFAYTCSAPPILDHIASGMYGMMIVEPKGGWPDGDAQEVTLVQSEFYGLPDKHGFINGDHAKMIAAQPDFIVFDGAMNKYDRSHPINLKVGKLVRVFLINAGPNMTASFHVAGVVFSTVYRGGNPANTMHGINAFEVAPSDGAVFEFTVNEPGIYNLGLLQIVWCDFASF